MSALTRPGAWLDYETRPSIDDLNGDLHRMREVERTSCARGCSLRPRPLLRAARRPAVGGLNGKANGIPGDAASSFTNRLDGADVLGLRPQHGRHELSHPLGVHHAVDNSLGISGGFLWWGGTRPATAVRSRPRTRPGTRRSSRSTAHAPGLGPIDNADDEVWGVDCRFARADENDLGLSDPEEVWALMGYCSDGDGQFRWSSAFERDQQIAGIRALAPAGGGGGGGGGGSWATPARSLLRPTSSCRRPAAAAC